MNTNAAAIKTAAAHLAALFARDARRLAELRAEDQRTPAEIAEDAAMAESEES